MENLVFKNSSKKIVGALWILFGVVKLTIKLVRKEVSDTSDWIDSVMFCLFGVLFFTPVVGSDKVKIEIGDECLRIRWVNWLRTVTVMESEIESIILARNGVMIKRKDNKPLKIIFNFIDKKQKEQVYRFFTDYAHEKNFTRESQLDQI